MTTSTRGKPHRKMKTGVFDAAMASHRGVFVSFCLRTRFLDMKREISIFWDEKLEKSIFSFFISKNLDSSFHVSKPSASKNSRKPRSASDLKDEFSITGRQKILACGWKFIRLQGAASQFRGPRAPPLPFYQKWGGITPKGDGSNGFLWEQLSATLWRKFSQG
jgi:hypothetical protein